MDVYTAPPLAPPSNPAGSWVTFLRIVLTVHAALTPFMAMFFFGYMAFFGGAAPDYDPDRLVFTGVAMTGLFVLDFTFKVAAAITVRSAPRRTAWYLGGSASVFIGYLAVLISYFQASIPLIYLPLGLNVLLAVELALYVEIRRQFPQVYGPPQPQRRSRADLIVLGSGLVLAGLLGYQQGINVNGAIPGGLPEYSSDDAPELIEGAYAEIAAELEVPPEEISSGPQSRECDEEFSFSQFWKNYLFETGSFEEIEPVMREVWTELGYDINESVTEEDGVPYLEATGPDGVEVVLTMGFNDDIDDNVILTVNSGCVGG